ncbi:putative protein TPRXL, partial [Stegastes partitus]|uniref:Uncharacterized protein n=1 Tax=Stegastes partitus TaxID=144197 RepID=A0A9Y4MW35_9TELE
LTSFFLSVCVSQASIHHFENVLVVEPLSTPLSSLLNIWPTGPSAGKKRSSLSLSDESDEESATESNGGNTGGGYQVQTGSNLVSSSSSSSSSSSVLVTLSPKPESSPSLSSKQPLDSFKSQLKGQIPTGTHSSAGLKHSLNTDGSTGEDTKADEMEKEVVGGCQDVNLLTLTFGRHEEDQEEEDISHHNIPKEELEHNFSSEECSSTLVLLSQTSDSKEVATETVSLGVDEDEEEEDIDSGYMGR